MDSVGNINIEKSYNVYQHDFSNFVEFEKKKMTKNKKKGKLEEFMR